MNPSQSIPRTRSQALPRIELSGRQLRDISDDAVAAVEGQSEHQLYQRGRKLYRKRDGVYSVAGDVALLFVLGRVADFVIKGRGGQWIPATPRYDIVAVIREDLLDSGKLPSVPRGARVDDAEPQLIPPGDGDDEVEEDGRRFHQSHSTSDDEEGHL